MIELAGLDDDFANRLALAQVINRLGGLIEWVHLRH